MIKEEAIEILSDMRAEYNIFSDDEEEATRYHALSWAIQALNEQQRTGRKKGKFIGTEYDGYADGNPVYYEWKCSACGCIFEDEEPTYNFCPNCGAEMEVEE